MVVNKLQLCIYLFLSVLVFYVKKSQNNKFSIVGNDVPHLSKLIAQNIKLSLYTGYLK